jgi:hypothetical protein
MRTATHTLLCLFLLFCACGKEDEENYHKFTQDDYNYIPTVYKEVGEVRHYINQHNDTIKIRGGSYFKDKLPTSPLYGHFYYYDKLWITLHLLGYSPTKYMSIEIFKDANNSLVHIVQISKSESCRGSWHEYYMPSDKQELTEMTLNTKVYKNVAVLSGELLENQRDDYCYFFIADTVTPDKVYYSLKYGIIGFDDTKNNLTYRLKE